MTKYICDKCGHIVQINLEEQNEPLICDICKGNMLSEQFFQEKEEIARLTDADDKDETLTPRQDAEEAKKESDDIIKFVIMKDAIAMMKNNIEKIGNDKTWYYIERDSNYKLRAFERVAFLQAGGKVPEGEPITI
jgi:DNA-directed RNA polymerase subunit RPC12/RpoP